MELDKKQKIMCYTKLSKNAICPTRASNLSAGLDLYSAEICTIAPKGKSLISTDLQLALPMGYYGRIAPRSGLSINHFIDMMIQNF